VEVLLEQSRTGMQLLGKSQSLFVVSGVECAIYSFSNVGADGNKIIVAGKGFQTSKEVVFCVKE
jgi:hypothetical protein